MGWILLVFALFSGLFALGLKKGISIVGGVLGRQVSDRHRLAEEILADGKVPRSWYREFSARHRRRHPGRRARGAEDREFRLLARKYFLRRLDRLLKYFAGAPVFDSEETRRMLTGRLQEARERWANERWNRIIEE